MSRLQLVLLAGGLATRLRPITEQMPKSMVSVCDKPFLQHQIEWAGTLGVRNIVLCLGHLGEQIVSYFGDGADLGVELRYSWDGGQLLGTGGALKRAEALLDKDFLVLYGDSYLPVDYSEIMQSFRQSGKQGLMVVYQNFDRYDKSNVAIDSGLVRRYDKSDHNRDLTYIDAGLSALRRESLHLLPENASVSLGELFKALIDQDQLIAWETQQRFYEIGSPDGLDEFRRWLEDRERSVSPRALQIK